MLFTLVPGAVLAEDTVEIGTVEELVLFLDAVNGGNNYAGITVRLKTDIDLLTVCGEDIGSWTPIGNRDVRFNGTFDGDGHKITGLYINAPDSEYQGLFGYIGNAGKIKNLGVDGSVSGGYEVCGIAGQNSEETIENSYNMGAISGDLYVGGLVGGNNVKATVTNCFYLKGTADKAIGNKDETADAVKTAEEFASGEVTHLLQNGQENQIWGQELNKDSYPVLTGDNSKKALQVKFLSHDETFAEKYVNPSGKINLPEKPDNTETHSFLRWSKTEDINGDRKRVCSFSVCKRVRRKAG